MEAQAALAQCYMKLGKDDEAMELLSEYQKTTTVGAPGDQGKGDAYLGQKANAEKQLGYLYWKKADRTKSLKFLQDFFNDAKADKAANARRVLDTARIAIGLAKGTNTIENYIETIQNSRENIYDLVEFKYQKDKK